MQTTAHTPEEKVGILLVNLGTPESHETPEVRAYLKEFLSDPRVLDINPLVRWLLLHFIILRTRPAKSGAAYKSIWTDEGSPLMVHSVNLAAQITDRIPQRQIALAMRYGQPSIASGMKKLLDQQIDRLIVVPLYPHYASSSTGTVLEEVYRIAARDWNTPNLHILPPFYNHPIYLNAMAEIFKSSTKDFKPDHVLFSYHGLPVRHVQKSDPTGTHCYQPAETCCDAICPANRHCYRAQCFETTRLLTPLLNLEKGAFTNAFQSRLGRTPWVEPYTDKLLETLNKDVGAKRLAVVCPSFVADCLETLEEIGMEGKREFLKHGGEDLMLVPSLNTEEVWVKALSTLLETL